MHEIELKETFMVEPDVIYNAWLNSEEHTKMTGGLAKCSCKVNGKFTAWDGYINGVNKFLIENEKIVQSWRTTEFKKGDKDSELIIDLKKVKEGTLLTLSHLNIPEEQSNYKQGWIDHYFQPMKKYFHEELMI